MFFNLMAVHTAVEQTAAKAAPLNIPGGYHPLAHRGRILFPPLLPQFFVAYRGNVQP